MKTLNGLRRLLGTRGALSYLKDYHQSRINPEGNWDTEVDKIFSYNRRNDWSCADVEADVISHANFMNECGSDLINYCSK